MSSSDESDFLGQEVCIVTSSFETFVKIKVGPSETEFEVQKTLLCEVSPFFKASFENGFREAREGTLSLPEEKVAVFKRFLLWLSTGKVHASRQGIEDLTWGMCFDLYIFAEAHDVTRLQNYMIDVLIGKRDRQEEIPTWQIRRLYESTPPEDPLRRLCVDWCMHDFLVEDVPSIPAQKAKHFPQEFLLELVRAQHKLLKKSKTKTIKKFWKHRDSYRAQKLVSRRR
ncbi:hypothetical protein MMC22_009340 [Lobaria immixta]|nr:hypothetical protein [Lobaria immixta]